MDFDDDGLAQKINGNRNASLVSTTDASETTVTADRVDLDLQPDGNESVLTQVAANGNAVVTSKPLPAPGRQLSETHVLRSETLEMKMRPGGREMRKRGHQSARHAGVPAQPAGRSTTARWTAATS